MELKPRGVVLLELSTGEIPFEAWFEGLRDTALMRATDARLTRIRDGNFGDHKNVGGGVFELRIQKGPGLRVYYGLDGPEVVVLIGGGDKKSQQHDIEKAKRLWKQYKHEN
jgi:putative addiction module killer protein